jgi:hypothetical protein
MIDLLRKGGKSTTFMLLLHLHKFSTFSEKYGSETVENIGIGYFKAI